MAKKLLIPAKDGVDVSGRLADIAAEKDTPVAEHKIASAGMAKMHVHVGSEADVVTLFAAKSMADYLKKISSAQFLPLSHDKSPQTGGLIIIGRENGLTDNLCPGINYDELGDEGFIIRSAGKNLVIAGATPRGTLNGVNWFLDRKLGVKWIKPDYTYIPISKELTIAKQNEKQIPRYSYREVLNTEGQDKLYKMRNLLTGESHGPSFQQTPVEYDILIAVGLPKAAKACSMVSCQGKSTEQKTGIPAGKYR